jgi:hypothetical protein
LEEDEAREHRREIIFEVIENQLRLNDPPETRATLNRLLRSGYSREEAFHLIGSALVCEIFDIMKSKHEFRLDRYRYRLGLLPDTSWLDESSRFEHWKRRAIPAHCAAESGFR